MDPWPFDVVVGVCHLIVTRTNTGRQHFLWYYWPPACGLVIARKQSLQSSREKKSRTMTALLHSVTDSCSHSGLISRLNRGRYAKHTFTRAKFFSMSDFISSREKTRSKVNLNRILRWVYWITSPPPRHPRLWGPVNLSWPMSTAVLLLLWVRLHHY